MMKLVHTYKKIGLLLLAVLLLMVYVSVSSDTTSPFDFAHFQTGDSAFFKLSMRDGTTGEAVSTTEQDKIDEFINLVEALNYTKKEDQQQRVGWSYTVGFVYAGRWI
jgi:hypothetical protein